MHVRARLMAMALVLGGAASWATASDLALRRRGVVTLDFIEASSASRNTLLLASPRARVEVSGCPAEAVPLPGVRIVTADQVLTEARAGCRVTLDADPDAAGVQPFETNAVLKFRLCVQTDSDPPCEQLWASRRGENADGQEHLKTAELHKTRFPASIFRLRWEDQPGLGDQDFNDMVAILRVDGDQDGDGLWDDWEAFGADTDGDGDVDVDLDRQGALIGRKDVFVELDWMSCTVNGSDCDGEAAGHHDQPPQESIDIVEEAFARAPVDGGRGVALHVQLGNALAHRPLLDLGCFQNHTFRQVKDDPRNFGRRNPRRFTHHYAISGHKQDPNDRGSAGCGDRPGNDFLITLGDWRKRKEDPDDQVRIFAGSLMHELGHNLGLQHGGHDEVKGKPNYRSVMNHLYELTGLPPDGRVDYSDQALPPLDEHSLSESAQESPRQPLTYACPSPSFEGRPSLPGLTVDWNCDGRLTPGRQKLDINADTFCVRPRVPGAGLQTQTQGDDQVVRIELSPPFSARDEDWITDGPNRVCETEADPDDQQLRSKQDPTDPRAEEQTRLLNGSRDWDRLKYAFQASPSHDEGSEVPPADESTLLPTKVFQVSITGATTEPAETVPAGTHLTYRTTFDSWGFALRDLVVEQVLDARTSFVSCHLSGQTTPPIPCVASGRKVRAEIDVIREPLTLEVVARVPASVASGTVLPSTVDVGRGEHGECVEGQEEFDCSDNHAEILVTVASADPTCPPGMLVIQGTPGNDILVGTSGDDCILGGAGDDVLQGGYGNDRLVGGDGHDQLAGEFGDDVLEGGAGDDQLNGGPGNDLLDGGAGCDACQGGGSPGDRLVSCEPRHAPTASSTTTTR